MPIAHLQRPSELPEIELFWYAGSSDAGPIMSIASGHWTLVFCNHDGRRYVVLRGPESKPTAAVYPAAGAWVGIQFAFGAFLPGLASGSSLVDGEIELPNSATGFWLGSSSWEYPTFDNIDIFTRRAAKAGLIRRDAIVSDTIARAGETTPMRSVQRRFLAVTGLSHSALRQIERARAATRLLQQGMSIADAAIQLGYYDQAHLTKHVHRLIGVTPAKLWTSACQLQLSIL